MPDNILDDNTGVQQPGQVELAPRADTEKPKASWIWMKDTAGFPSVSVTFAAISFWVTAAAYIASIFEKIGPFAIRPFDPAACGSFLGLTMSLYFGRRFTDAKFGTNK